jgi:sarcosine oxidase subunit beta
VSADRVAVIGAGVIGASVAWHLTQARPGCDVVLIDTHLPTIGATAYSAGILRRHHSLASDVELAARSLPFYQQFDERVGGSCGYTPRGFLVIVPPRFAESLQRNRAVIDGAGTATELLDAGQLATRYPGLLLSGDELGLLEADGGYGSAQLTTQALRAGFTAAGGTTLTGVRVDELATGASGTWTLRTNIGDLAATQVVLAAGAASTELAATVDLALSLTPRRIGLAVLDARGTSESELPVCIDDVTGTYFVPRADGSTAVGVRARPECQQIIPAQPLTAAEISEALARGTRRVPGFAGRVVIGTQAACDGYTPDGRPLLGPVAGHPGLHLACGFSGGGFKIAPAVGELIAAAVLGAAPAPILAGYSADRFAAGRPLGSETAYVHL